MTTSLRKRSKATGVVPAAASFALPGAGQLINGQGVKAVGVFGVALATGAAFLTGLPLLGAVIGAAHVVTHVYAVGDAYVQARKKRR